MKKAFIPVALALMSTVAVSAQEWGLGVRVGSGIQAVGQKHLNSNDYLELRAGYSYIRGNNFDVSLLYAWDLKDWGDWRLDLGLGANVAPGSEALFLGVQGMVRLQYDLPRAPWAFGVDFSPAFGPSIGLKKGVDTEFDWKRAFTNFGISALYKF